MPSSIFFTLANPKPWSPCNISETRDAKATATAGVVQGTRCRAGRRGSITGDERMEGFWSDVVASTRISTSK